MPSIREQYIQTGKVLYIYRQFPLTMHRNAIPAAEAALCAADQGAFVEMHDRIYEGQLDWANDPDPKPWFSRVADDLGLDRKTFDRCLGGREKVPLIQSEIQEALSRGAGGTPFFLVVDKPYGGAIPFEVFQQEIDAALQ